MSEEGKKVTHVLPTFILILGKCGLVTIVKMDEDSSDLNDILKIENALGGAVGSRENESYYLIRCKYCFQNLFFYLTFKQSLESLFSLKLY